MKISNNALAIALAGFTISMPVSAQYGSPPPPTTGGNQPPADEGEYQGLHEQTTIRSGSGSAASR